MKCDKLRQDYMEAVLSGPEAVSPDGQEHLRSCPDCAEELASFRQTMALMDEWEAPEASPYFLTRVRARVREEAAAAPSPFWLAWLRKPVLAGTAALLLAVGIGLLEINPFSHDKNTYASNDGVVRVNTTPGTAVNDLQYLDKNADLFTEFDALDGQSSATE